MSDPRAHVPKLRALHAHREGRLSARGRARLERHLARCEVCCEALTGLSRYAVLLEDVRGALPPAMDVARIEASLEREALRVARRRQVRRLLLPLSLAAAAALAFVLARESGSPRAPQARAPRVQQVPAKSPPAEAPELAVRITALLGDVQGNDEAGRAVPISLETVPREGWTLATGRGAELHLSIEKTAALLLPARSRMRLARVRAGGIALELLAGGLVQAVQPGAKEPGYSVAAAGHVMEVRGTHFGVEHRAAGLSVQVDEGTVAVLRDGVLVAEVRAPGRWQTDSSKDSAGEPRPLRRPYSPAPGFEAWPALQLPSWPRIAAWELDGVRFEASADLSLRAPPDSLTLLAVLDDGTRVPAPVTLDALGTRFDPRSLRLRPRRRSDPIEHEAAPDPTAAASVIRSSQPALQRCYERSMKRGQLGALRARLWLQIAADGKVVGAELRADTDVPPLLERCIQSVARGWRFAATGDSIALEAPLVFRPRN